MEIKLNVHFSKDEVNFCAPHKLVVEVEEVLEGELVWIQGVTLKKNFMTIIVMKCNLHKVITDFI